MNVTTPTGSNKVDLVIVIDTSRSMKDEAKNLSVTFDQILASAMQQCPSDLEVKFLGIEGTFAKTKFNRSVRDYLAASGVDTTLLKSRINDPATNTGAREDVARSVEDIAAHYNWRPGAERNMFVLGDESLEGGGMQVGADQLAARKLAVEVAKDNQVKVFTYLGTPLEAYGPGEEAEMIKEYQLLALRTGGNPYIHITGIAGFQKVLTDTICASRTPQQEAIANNQDEADQIEGVKPEPSKPECAESEADEPECAESEASEPECVDPKPGKPEGVAPGRDICNQAGEVIRAVNTLADILNKLLDACGGLSNSNSNGTPKPSGGCTCKDRDHGDAMLNA